MVIVEQRHRGHVALAILIVCGGCGGRVREGAQGDGPDAVDAVDIDAQPSDALSTADAALGDATIAIDTGPAPFDATADVAPGVDAVVAPDVAPDVVDAIAAIDAVVSVAPAPVCAVSVSFTAPTWKAPTPFHQGRCTAAQLSAYEGCLGSASCTSTDAACDACLQTPASAAAYGPVILGTGDDDGFGPGFVNWGGCQANVDGHVGAGSCGNETNDWQACASAVCPYEACGEALDACDDYAYDVTCVGHTESDACASEWSNADAGVPPCADFLELATLWCGP